MKGKTVQLKRAWTVGEKIGSGGFAEVYVTTTRDDDDEYVAKFIPKTPGAGRELLFEDLPASPYIMPIIETGEFGDYWVLVMPRADCSLRQHLGAHGGQLDFLETIAILKDVSSALVDLENKVVHRDVKPENVLLLGGHWCLADFGISRYAEASTAADTRKFSMTYAYAAPERWRSERATVEADIYSVGIMGFEMIAGHRPFEGPDEEDFREQHLQSKPAQLKGVTAAYCALIDECLYKAPGARPTPANLRARLEIAGQPPSSRGLSALQEANREEVARLQEADRKKSETKSEHERRIALAEAGQSGYESISELMCQSIEEAASAGRVSRGAQGSWQIRLGDAVITMAPSGRNDKGDWGNRFKPAFETIIAGHISIRISADRGGYEGRSHSLWYCDCQETGRFGWYEIAFMYMPLVQRPSRQDPFFLDPGAEAAEALANVLGIYTIAWPFTEITMDNIDDFVSRWGEWFAKAFLGQLRHPSHMPERKVEKNWRES